MRKYGHKKKKPRGDGCFLCTKDRKETKSAVRGKVKKELSELIKSLAKPFPPLSKKEIKEMAKNIAKKK